MTKKTNIIAKCILLWFSAQCVLVYGRSDSPCPALELEPWSYEGESNGPEEWGRTYPMCNGEQQSPINIKTGGVKLDRSLDKLRMVNYNIPVRQADALNNGHTVEITPRDGVQRYIVIDGSNYILQQFHFHWSNKSNDGTEHAFNRRRYNMEGHFVHSNDQNETAVVGVLYKATYWKNKAFQPIVDILPRVQYQDDEAEIVANISLDGLLPSNPASFYRYMGSLTTPPCTEGVKWNVLQKVSYVGRKQLQQFFELYAVPKAFLPERNPSACKIHYNVRPLQDINGRRVAASR